MSTTGSSFPKVEFSNFERSNPPQWMGDYANRDSIMPGGALLDKAQFMTSDGAKVTLTAQANAAATSLAVAALANKIPSGTILYFGAGEFALTTAEAAKGATTIAVEALPTQIESGDVATYLGTGRRFIPSGTLIGRTFTERNSKTGFGPAVDTDDEFFILAYDVVDADQDAQCELYRNGRLVYEDLLPEWTAISANANLLAKLRARYQTTKSSEQA